MSVGILAAGVLGLARHQSADVATGAESTLAGVSGSRDSGRSPDGGREQWRTRELTSPDRVQVLDRQGLVATFTVGARTVSLRGAPRVFQEPLTTDATVPSTTWVRLLPRPFAGKVDDQWLEAALRDTSPDVLTIAMQYVTGVPTVRDRDGKLVSSDAGFGPLRAGGGREEGSDFNDYLEVPWRYGDTVDPPERGDESFDCSGFVRMVFGYRAGMPLSLDPVPGALPRRSYELLSSAPGVLIIENRGQPPASTDGLLPGDLVFFDLSENDETEVGHMGIYLGPDDHGDARFVSSRMIANGPTMGDVGGEALLNGTGYYAHVWRAARRL